MSRPPPSRRDALPPRDERAYGVVASLLSGATSVLYRVRVAGAAVPASGPALLAANHVSFLDPVLLLVVLHRLGRRVRFLGVAAAFERPVSGALLRRGGHIPVGSGWSAARALALAARALDQGDLVALYPEGTIPLPGGAATVRPGVGALALRSGAPVLPVAVWGVQRGTNGRAHVGLRRPAAVVIGSPVDLRDLGERGGAAAATQAAGRIMAGVQELLPDARRLAGE